jgi:hypothetical protein
MTDGPSAVAEAATDAPAPKSVSEKAADFENYLFGDEEDDDSPEQDQTEGDEAEEELDLADEEQAGEEDEPDVPAIDAPASLNAEEKKVFAQLPAEAQQAWADSENRRNQQVQDATTKAAAKERDAQTALERADAQAAVHYAAQLKAWADTFRPQMPDPQLANMDPMRYIAEKAHYDAQVAQFNDLEQQIASVRDEAFGNAAQIDQRTRVADLMSVPELANPETRDTHVKWAREVVSELGLDPDAFEQNADSTDFKSLKRVDEWRTKAAKYDAAMSRKMQKVRSAQGKTLRPNAAPQAPTRAAQTDQAWQKVKNAGNNKSQRDQAAAEWLESAGYL